MRTQVSGASCETVVSLAFGDGQATSGTCEPSPMHFTGKQRDTETNLDDFDARYYSSQWGRFISADWSNVPVPVPYANFTNPQTLNLYAMVADSPETFVDLNGHVLLLEGNVNAAASYLCDQTGPDCHDFSYDPKTDQVTFSCQGKCDNLTPNAQYIKSLIDSPTVSIFSVSPTADGGGYAPHLQQLIQTCQGSECTERKILEAVRVQAVMVVATGGLAEAAEIGLAALRGGAVAADEAVSVYRIVKDGETTYVGITNNVA